MSLNVAKNNPTEKQTDAKIQETLKHAPAWKLTEEKNEKFTATNCKDLFKL